MKKLVITLLLIATVLPMAFAQASTETKPIELVYTMAAVPTDAHTKAMMVFKETVERLSGGQIKVSTFDSASLFRQEQETAAVKSGQADMTALGAAWLSDDSPWVSMFTAGYMFKTYDHMNDVLNGAIGQEVFDRIAKEQGIRPLGAEYLGTRQVNLVADKPVITPNDLRGVNLRMPDTDAYIFLGKAIGANPTPISFNDLYMALQTRTVDGQDNPLPTNMNAKFYEVTKSVSITNHLIDSVWVCINEAKWQSLNAQQKEWVMAGVQAGIDFCNKTNLDAEAELIDFFKSKGQQVYYADLDAFADHVLPLYLASPTAKTWDMDLFRRVQEAGN